MEYDRTRPFLDQVKELSEKTPYAALETEYLTLKNCDYNNGIAFSKDCYMSAWADYCESAYYSSILNGLKFSADCLRGWNSELCYESIGVNGSYRTFFSDGVGECVDVWFSRSCNSCTNCFGCVNLRGASYQIFNLQYSKEEYFEKLKEMRLDSWSALQEWDKKSKAFWLTKPYKEYHGNSLNLNVTGEYVYESKNSKEAYISSYVENSKYTQLITVASTKDCYDYSGWGNGAELLYECVQSGNGVHNSKFASHCFSDVINTEYCHWAIGAKNNFGCVNLKRKQYCILNKEYSKEEYEKLKAEIIEDMKKRPYVDELGRTYPYGEFFHIAFGKFAYNNSNANKFFPKTKEQALSEGYSWNDEEPVVHKVTIDASVIPDTIATTTESILDEVIECMSCTRGYKVVKGELDLLRKMGLPAPHECPKCRENRRFAQMNKPGLHHRECAKCNAPIYTPYAPNRPEIVYCVKCYQAEFA